MGEMEGSWKFANEILSPPVVLRSDGARTKTTTAVWADIL